MDTGFGGRKKKVTGKADIHTSSKPVQSGQTAGKDVSYSKRREGANQGHASYSSGAQQSGAQTERAVTRGLGGGKLIIIVIIAALLLGGGKLSGLFGGLLGGSSGGGATQSTAGTLLSGLGGLLGGSSSSSASSGLGITDLLGGFSGGGSVSTGWAREANTGTLDRDVANTARAKRTQILDGGKDTFTIMVYMCGTDLESKSGMASNDLQEMAKATIGKNINLIVYTGGCSGWKIQGISSSVNQIYKVETGKLIPLVKDAGKATMVDPANLTEFIQFCTKHYPANRQALIFWDHGGGSISGYGYDEKKPNAGTMDLSEIKSALKNAGTTFDFIGFDACLMATLETGLMLDDYADYMIASEETEPGIGWYYTPWLNSLSANTSMPTIEIGKNIVDAFVDECNKRCAGQKTTLSVVDLAELSATVPAELKSFATSTSKLISSNNYKTVSDARSATREFAASNRIDQVDLVHLCTNLNTKESQELATALLGAVKYNKTSSSITNSYGISIYFPYNRANYVNTAVKINKSIGLDNEYSRCIQQFATVEHGGQQASSSAGFSGGLDISSLLGGMSSSGGGADIGSLLGSLLGGRSIGLDNSTVEQTLTDNFFDASKLVWTEEDGMKVMRLPAKQWEQVHELKLNVFVEDGDGYMNLGMDSSYTFKQDGALVGKYDRTWLGYEDTLVMFNYEDTVIEDGKMILSGNVPILLNGERAELLVSMVYAYPSGEEESITVTGVRYVYDNGEENKDDFDTERDPLLAVAKDAELTAAGEDAETASRIDPETGEIQKADAVLREADEIIFLCDRYDKNGEATGIHEIVDADGSPIRVTYNGKLELSYKEIDESRKVVATYCFTDIYSNEHWTAPMD